ncbi:hypothetical protein MSG28_013854 [Choristoneura fumiferana]|uniref:Uncharacterized protein n=1 Tax=Choristoneura fumiferana TaxID=7141 RepID=A0ACC0K922_CHOFU|nr:hypothetical protein MSG28_013854 [Choristoneura fumiferana]
MDILSSTLNNAVNFNPATTIDSVVSSLQLLATVASIANVSWPENSPVKGLWPLATHSPYDWDFVSEVDDCTSHALHGKRTAHTRGKVLGGSSTINHSVVQRGSKLDFDEWVKAGHTNWNWESVLKYFKKAENMLDKKLVNGPTSKYHCDKGPFSVKPQSKNKLFVEKNGRLLKGYSELGMHILEDPFVPIPNGTGGLYLHIKDDKEQSRRASTAEEYLLPIKDKSNFHILKEAQVIKILTNHNKEAIGIFNNYFSDENDLERMIEAVKKIKELENVPEYSDVGGRFIRPPLPECDDLDYQSHSYWACYVKNMATTIFNPASTCAMGLVVDDNLKVKGMKKLRVVDDSVIPFLPRGTTTMITIMIAEKAADIIKKEHEVNKGLQCDPPLATTEIEQVNVARFLGLMVDAHGTWESHVDYASKKLNRFVFVLRKLTNIASEKTALLADHGHVEST